MKGRVNRVTVAKHHHDHIAPINRVDTAVHVDSKGPNILVSVKLMGVKLPRSLPGILF